jgi:tetratricopeptide (TPR) repeat protein
VTRPVPQILPAIMGALRQERAEGTLTLEQNDGTRRIHWTAGEIFYLQSDVAGEQFGNYLLRQGILDFPSLSELLANEERFRLGEKVVQWGLMSLDERDLHLRTLQEQVMIHALEHTIIEMDWKAGTARSQLSEDLHFKLDHRQFVWSTFHEAHNLGDLCDLLYAENKWRWVAPADLLSFVGDLPLTPKVAYALSFWGPEAVGYETFLSLSGMDEEDGARLLVTLWALGGLTLSQGSAPSLTKALLPPPPVPVVPVPTPLPPLVMTPPRTAITPSAPLPPLSFANAEAKAPKTLDFLPPNSSQPLPLDPFIPTMPETTIQLDDEDARSQEASTAKAHKYLLKAKNFLVQERTAEAIRLLEQSVQLDPESEQAFEPWLLLGKHRLSNPAWSNRAIEALQAASKLRPKAAEPWALMGEIYHRKSFKANARACFKKALDLDPSIPIPPDVNLKEEDVDPEERSRPGLLNRFKAFLGRSDKS